MCIFLIFSGLRSSCVNIMDNSSLSCSSPSLPSGYSSVDLLDEVELTDERKQRGGMFECRDSKHVLTGEGGVLTRSQSIPGLKYLLSPVLTTLLVTDIQGSLERSKMIPGQHHSVTALLTTATLLRQHRNTREQSYKEEE